MYRLERYTREKREDEAMRGIFEEKKMWMGV